MNSYQKHVDELNRNQLAAAGNNTSWRDQTKRSKGYIPCLYLPYLGGSSKLLIYFHGNAEDVGLAMELLAFVKDMLKVSNQSHSRASFATK